MNGASSEIQTHRWQFVSLALCCGVAKQLFNNLPDGLTHGYK